MLARQGCSLVLRATPGRQEHEVRLALGDERDLQRLRLRAGRGHEPAERQGSQECELRSHVAPPLSCGPEPIRSSFQALVQRERLRQDRSGAGGDAMCGENWKRWLSPRCSRGTNSALAALLTFCGAAPARTDPIVIAA